MSLHNAVSLELKNFWVGIEEKQNREKRFPLNWKKKTELPNAGELQKNNHENPP